MPLKNTTSRPDQLRSLDRALQRAADELLAFYNANPDGQIGDIELRSYDLLALTMALRGQIGHALTHHSGAPLLRAGGSR